MYTSITDEKIRTIVTIRENIVCLRISIFTFSILLSFIIELYNLIPLTAKANIHGTNKIVCKSSEEVTKRVPFPHS